MRLELRDHGKLGCRYIQLGLGGGLSGLGRLARTPLETRLTVRLRSHLKQCSSHLVLDLRQEQALSAFVEILPPKFVGTNWTCSNITYSITVP